MDLENVKQTRFPQVCFTFFIYWQEYHELLGKITSR